MDYNFSETGNFSKKDFHNQIKNAQDVLKRQSFNNQLEFSEERNTKEIGYGKYFGNFIKYKITDKNKKIGYLNCFLSSENEFMEIMFIQD